MQDTLLDEQLHPCVVQLKGYLEKCPLFKGLGYNFEVVNTQKNETLSRKPTFVLKLIDKLKCAKMYEDLHQSNNQQKMFSKVELVEITHVYIDIKLNYALNIDKQSTQLKTLTKDLLIQDLNYLLIVAYTHLENDSPLLFKTSSRKMVNANMEISQSIANALSKNEETKIMHIREISVGLLKAATKGPSLLESIASQSKFTSKFNRIKKNVNHREQKNEETAADGSIKFEDPINLEWFVTE